MGAKNIGKTTPNSIRRVRRSRFELWFCLQKLCEFRTDTLHLWDLFFHLYQRSANFCCKGPEGKYFRLRKRYNLCGISSGPSISPGSTYVDSDAEQGDTEPVDTDAVPHYFIEGTKASMDLGMGGLVLEPIHCWGIRLYSSLPFLLWKAAIDNI